MAEPESTEPTQRTARLWREAQGVLAAGLWTVTQGAWRYPDGLFPLLAESGHGCTLLDTTGRAYVDWLMAWGTAILGYRHPEVELAIADQLRHSGPLLSLLAPIEVQAARKVRELVPCADVVAFAKNGSDGLEVAARIARAATGRERILVCGYHGFHDWYMASQPWCEGVSEAARSLVTFFPYGDLSALRSLLESDGDRIAAVVLEPVNTTMPSRDYLPGVRELTLEHEVLLVFDEVMTAFRVARGGAQELFGVSPDLACLGKAMANGMPLAALVGKRDVMQVITRVGYGATFRGEALSLAACLATLEVVDRESVPQKIAATGERLREGFRAGCRSRGVAADLHGPPGRMTATFASAGGITPLGLQTLFVQECLKRGVLTNGLFLPSLAHGDEALARTDAAFAEALTVVARAIEGKSLEPWLCIPALQVFHEDATLEESGPR